MGVGNYTEEDVYAAARVFTGWNLTRPAQDSHICFLYNAAQQRSGAKTFTLPSTRRREDDPGPRGVDGMQTGWT